jgi:hypothetical protein
VAYNSGGDGRVTPQSCYKGFESFSFGQRKRPSTVTIQAEYRTEAVPKRLRPGFPETLS